MIKFEKEQLFELGHEHELSDMETTYVLQMKNYTLLFLDIMDYFENDEFLSPFMVLDIPSLADIESEFEEYTLKEIDRFTKNII